MDKDKLQQYVEVHIPIVKALKFSIKEIIGDDVVIEAPHKEHINHVSSAFGGSTSALMTLAGWAKMRIIMERIDPKATIVIQSSEVKFLKPVMHDFIATTAINDSVDFSIHEEMYHKHGKTKARIKVLLKEKGKEDVFAVSHGLYVVISNY